ncbi:lysozyme [Methylobacterium durans]|uniref:Lysozyme n=1 Tax=Methylobacterium durans TaxID=2202825 RepID=A0A2U8WG64_9HYPH|nr:lysozyme [Methylobacterium durans]AWN44528.1 glycoside hydrolase [Methylobacterium durans]
MMLTQTGRAVLIAREGRRLSAYRDSAGIWTIGVRHTSAAGPPRVTPGLTLTEEACDALFARDVARFEAAVRETVPPDLPDHAFDALVSLCFNIGTDAFRRSTVVRRLRAGDRAGAGAAILLWNRPPELIPRRQAEADQFRTPYAEGLPRARRGDPATVPGPPPASLPPSLPPSRRPVPSAPVVRTGGPGPAGPGPLARLWRRLRARLGRT